MPHRADLVCYSTKPLFLPLVRWVMLVHKVTAVCRLHQLVGPSRLRARYAYRAVMKLKGRPNPKGMEFISFIRDNWRCVSSGRYLRSEWNEISINADCMRTLIDYRPDKAPLLFCGYKINSRRGPNKAEKALWLIINWKEIITGSDLPSIGFLEMKD